jgi:L-serine dehydratase
MQQISVFDMFKIGVGPSSSHTLGPWRAAEDWISELKSNLHFEEVQSVRIILYGSLSLTGRGHATDLAVIMGLSGEDPERMKPGIINSIISLVRKNKTISLGGQKILPFDLDKDLVFSNEFLPFHPNGITFCAGISNKTIRDTYYSIGGGFILKEGDDVGHKKYERNQFPFPVNSATELLSHCRKTGLPISSVVYQNELSIQDEEHVLHKLGRLWDTMLVCMYNGCHTEGYLPGPLQVKRRAAEMHMKLIKNATYSDQKEWMTAIRGLDVKFQELFKWISCLAISVNEVNASLGRIVTAPTNGSAGVIPAVLLYYLCFVNKQASSGEVERFLLVAGELGSIFKKGATISAALGGCQAEIGVSSAMAAGALTELLGGTPEQALIAAEIAMEHHLGLTCDPVGGLVQIPCIERNAMGAIKAVNAAELALDRNPEDVLVPLDKVISTMWETAKDMHHKYKETSEGGLAVTVNVADC